MRRAQPDYPGAIYPKMGQPAGAMRMVRASLALSAEEGEKGATRMVRCNLALADLAG
jgi:hypothetical protein